MATITTNASYNRSLSLDVWEIDVDIVNNKRLYGWKLYGSGSAGGYVVSGNFKAIVGGVQVYYSTTRINLYNGTTVAQGEVWINHNSDGTKYIDMYCEAGIYQIAVNCTASGGFWGTSIPRYANFTSHYLQSNGLNTIQIHWTADTTCDAIQYSLNDGSYQNTSGYPIYTITGLTPNTTYSVKTKIRRTDSQLWTESSAINLTTHDIAKISTASNINFGDTTTVTVTNPSGVRNDLRVETLNPTKTIATRTNIGTSTTLTFSQAELDTLYSKMTNNSPITIRYVVDTYNGSVVGWYNWVDKTLTMTGNAKTIYENVSGTWKRANVWVNISGTWKKGLIWTNVSGTWKRGK